MKTLTYKEYQIINMITENIDEFMSEIDLPEVSSTEIETIYKQQQDILKGYNLSDSELENITKGLEDTIRTKLGLSESVCNTLFSK